MSMNVAKAWTDAYTAAIILLALTHVVVIRDTVLMIMDIHAMVSLKIEVLLIEMLLISILDINECAGNQHQCDHICFNNNGSYSCGCRNGYRLIEDGRTCHG